MRHQRRRPFLRLKHRLYANQTRAKVYRHFWRIDADMLDARRHGCPGWIMAGRGLL